MKKVIAIVLACLLALSCMVMSVSAQDKPTSLSFKEDGTFKILMINDFQDRDKCLAETVEFIKAALDQEQPDLVVFAGDQLCDVFPGATAEKIEKALDNQMQIFEEYGVPVLATLGNHDHDRESALDEAGQYAVYSKYSCFINTGNGPEGDGFTCNLPIMSSDGNKVAMSVYAIDTNNKESGLSYTGINAGQLDWYNNMSASLKEANGGEVVPSLVFQHVPVKEVYNLLEVCEFNDKGAIYARRDGNWYKTKDTTEGTLGEAPCSEDFDIITGQYQAWVENGDIIGAWFAHDHVNTFSGTTEDGIRMGYNGGTGFRSYGNGADRTIRVFNISEDDVANYETHLITYSEVTGKSASIGTYFTDLASPALLTTLMKVVYALFGWAIKLFK